MDLPIGIADFARIRSEGYYYLDKTPFIPVLEDRSKGRIYSCFLRPRRFGKSTFLSMLRSYYDIAAADDFDRLFQGLYVHEHPTKEKNSYLILDLEFTGLSVVNGVHGLLADFYERVRRTLDRFFERYHAMLADVAPRWPAQAEAQLLRYQSDERLLQHAGPGGLRPVALVFQGFEEIFFRAAGEPTQAISACLEEEDEGEPLREPRFPRQLRSGHLGGST